MSEEIYLCLSDLLDQDVSSYEYFNALPEDLRRRIREEDLRSFRQIQDYTQAYYQDGGNKDG